MRNYITIQLRRDEILIRIREGAEQKDIVESLERKLEDLEKLYKEEKTPIKVRGKMLKNSEMEEIEDIIKSKINVDVTFENPATLGLHGIRKAFDEKIKSSATTFHKGSLRSGQKIEYEGSIVIIGDVNAGAEVIAGENIVILGNLRGLAHAGAKGNKQAIIAAQKIETPQIRVSDLRKEFEIKDKENTYTYTYVNENNEIVVE